MMNREMGRSYRETLLANGVPEKQIKELFFWPDGSEDYAKIRGADGMLCSHFLVLLHSVPLFLPLIDPAKLHIDCPCGAEMENTHQLFSPAGAFETSDIRCIFGSVMIHQYKIQDIAPKVRKLPCCSRRTVEMRFPQLPILILRRYYFILHEYLGKFQKLSVCRLMKMELPDLYFCCFDGKLCV